jgi:hypothetical protein
MSLQRSYDWKSSYYEVLCTPPPPPPRIPPWSSESDVIVVSMGITDILTPWSVRKQLEHWLRVYVQFQDPHGISCVHPQQYQQRFRDNVIASVIRGKKPVPRQTTGGFEWFRPRNLALTTTVWLEDHRKSCRRSHTYPFVVGSIPSQQSSGMSCLDSLGRRWSSLNPVASDFSGSSMVLMELP